MKIRKKYILLAVILVVGGGYYWYSQSKKGNDQVQYVTAPAEKGTLTTSISGSGNAIVDQQANVDPTITGTVANLAVAVGDPVKKGQLLFTIVNEQLSVTSEKSLASYLNSLASLESAEASKKSAKNDDESSKTNSAKQNQVLEEKLEAAAASVDSAEKSASASLSDLNYQRQQAAKRQVAAPITGTVNAVNIKNGDDLSKLTSGSSRQVPMVIGDLSTIKAQVQINEVDVPNVQIGQKAMMTFNSVEGLTVSGQVEKIDSLGTITQGVVIYNATIGFDTLDPRIKPGMSVSASIITGLKQDVIIVPNSAVKMQGNSNYVEVLNSGTAPQQVAVEIGAVNNTDTEIVSGLNVGDKVVTRTINPGTAATTSTSTPGQGGGGFGGGGFRGLR
jgi:RND family efflux transporter MFP subunit